MELYRAAYGDQRPIDDAEVVAWCRNSELKPDWLRVLEEGDRIVGYGDIVVSGDTVAVDLAAPDHWDVFLEWAEDEARARGVCSRPRLLPGGARACRRAGRPGLSALALGFHDAGRSRMMARL